MVLQFAKTQFIMKKLFFQSKAIVLLSVILLGVTSSLQAVSKGAGMVTLISPTSNSSYHSTIQAAYDAINFGTSAGNYTIEVTSAYDPAGETLPISLAAKADASETNNITIRPAAGASITITGSSKIISFNGAKFVTVDGRAAGSGTAKGFTFTNTSVAATASTIDFVNDAYKNTLKYCTVLGAGVAAQGGSPAAITSGNIVIGTTTGTVARGGDATAGFTGSGNMYNTIDNCDIAEASLTTLPTAGVCMIGTAVYTNEGNVISNCQIYNCFNPNYNYSAAVFVGANSQSSIITYNKIYQTVARTFFTYGIHTPIHINTATKEISFNTIGYAKNDGTGTYTIGGAQSHKFQGMKLTGTVTTMKGNVISDIDISTTSVGAANIGIVCGIFNEGNNFPAGDVNNPNIIRNITLNGSGALAATATFSMAGISTTSWTGGNVMHNVIDNLKVNFTGANAATIKGILYGIYAIQSWGITVKQNRISNLKVGIDGNSGANVITAISATPQANQGVTCEKNEIYNLNAVSSAGAIVTGIFANGGTGASTIKNNIVNLGNDMASPAEIRGIYKSSIGKDVIYHNTIYIGGTTTGTTANTYCYYRNAATPTATGEACQNNIFVNKRSGGSTGIHYAVKMLNAADYSGAFIACTNNLLLVDTSSKLAFIGADVADFATFTSSYPDFAAGSKNADPMFVAPLAATPDMHVSSENSAASLSGVAIASVTDDFYGMLRANYSPVDMGAIAIGNYTTVENVKLMNLNVYAISNSIVFNNLEGSTATIYSLNGQQLKSFLLTSNKVTVPSAKGCFVVKVGNENAKVIVK